MLQLPGPPGPPGPMVSFVLKIRLIIELVVFIDMFVLLLCVTCISHDCFFQLKDIITRSP